MKIAICGDIHISKTSSIIRTRGEKYSTRIENCIKSIEWFEQIAKEKGCQLEVYLGDTFDKPQLTDEELTAIKDIHWNDISKYFLVGNHESSVNGLEYNSVKALEGKNRFVISEQGYTFTENLTGDRKTQLHFLPYIIESDREPLINYLRKNPDYTKHIIFSHNDIMGIKYGGFESKVGFDIKEIEDNCDLFINGHLHNGEKVTDKIINLGILTGQNFGENALRYKHNIMILDTETLQYEYIENPYAFNFYNIEINDNLQFTKLGGLKDNAVVSIKCSSELVNDIKDIIKDLSNIISYKITTIANSLSTTKVDRVEDFTMNHLEKFVQCVKEKIGTNNIIDYELNEVIK